MEASAELGRVYSFLLSLVKSDENAADDSAEQGKTGEIGT